jgi:hypothetical protein
MSSFLMVRLSGCPVPAKMEHSTSAQVRFCIVLKSRGSRFIVLSSLQKSWRYSKNESVLYYWAIGPTWIYNLYSLEGKRKRYHADKRNRVFCRTRS